MPLFIKLRRARHTTDNDVIYFQTNNIRIYSSQEAGDMPLDFDGEQIGALPAQIECVKGAIRIFIPEKTKLIL